MPTLDRADASRAPSPGGLGDLSARQSRDLERLQGQWRALGESAGQWAVAEVPGGPPSGAGPEEFLRTGVDEVRSVAARARTLEIHFSGSRALDFGCGPGRMTQALAESYREVVGVDVSPAMAELARSLLRSPLPCRFETAAFPDLRPYGTASFDLAFSVYVLQHLPRWLAERYVREFVRVVRPGGSIVFQLHGGLAGRGLGWVSGRWLPGLVNRWSRWRASRRGAPFRWEVHWIRPPEVVRILRSAGARVVAVDRVPRPDGRLQGYWFFAVREEGPRT